MVGQKIQDIRMLERMMKYMDNKTITIMRMLILNGVMLAE